MNTSSFHLPLTPKILGENWEAYEWSSGFGVLWRAMRLNFLRRSDLLFCLKVRIQKDECAFSKMTRSSSQHDALLLSFPVKQFLNSSAWQIQEWWPFGGSVPFDVMEWRLRACPVCARSCYHSLLFQMPGIKRCPWHGVELIERCLKCKLPLLLDFHEDIPLGQCPCGHDLVDYVATAAGETKILESKRNIILEYMSLAKASRETSWLLPPETSDAEAWRALHCLAAPKLKRCENVLVDVIRLQRCLKFPPVSLSPRTGLESHYPGLASLPLAWTPDFQNISDEILAMTPNGRLQSIFNLEGKEERALGRLPANIFGANIYLTTECLDRAVLRCVSKLVRALMPILGGDGPVGLDLSSRVHRHALGSRLVERVVRRVITRGYADGTRVALRRRYPETFEDLRCRSVRRLPWVLLELPNGWASAAVAWTQQGGPS